MASHTRIRSSARILLAALCGCMAVALSSGCSTTKLAVGAMGPILDNTKTAAMRSNDTRTFYAGIPSNLILLEGFIEKVPDKENLLRDALAQTPRDDLLARDIVRRFLDFRL